MKARLLKLSVITTMVIFLFTGNSWADRGRNRHHHQDRNKHIRIEHDNSHGYHESSHYYRGWHKHPRRCHKKHYDRRLAAHRAERHAFKHRHEYHRRVHKYDHQRHRVIHKHYHKHKPSYNVFSFRAPALEPGWSFIIMTKSRW